jgi:hypothetical protein
MRRSVLFSAVAWGALLSVIVVLTNVVFPSPNESDDEYTGWYIVLYLGLFLLFAIGGAVTALIIVGVIMLTFAVIDNVFLDIVSQQIDKINAFHAQTTFTTMRDFMNSGLLLGTVVILPVVAVVDAALGAFASLLRRHLTSTAPAVA